MSRAEELLNSLTTASISRSANAFEEPHFIIDDDRRITVPEELKRIAVQWDHYIETVTFDCPRYWDDHDMSKMSIYINYLRTDYESSFYRADNIRVDDIDPSIMHFDWTISRNVTEVYGNIVFLVCIRGTDKNGNEINHWNSELCKDCYVSEGLECDAEELKEQYPDIIAQWYKEVTEVTDFGKSVADDLIARRDAGEFDGVTFTPSVAENGDISWTNNKGKENPKTVNILGPQGVSPTIEVKDIHGGHRITITDVNGTKSIDVLNTIVDKTEAVAYMLNQFVYIGDEEPTSTPVLWLDTKYSSGSDLSTVVDDLVQSELEAIENGSY